MATVKCPTNVTSITFATSGVKVPDGSNNVTGLTALEANALSQQGQNSGNNLGAAKLVSTASNGNVQISLPVVVTGITINAVPYTVTGAVTPWGKLLSAAVPAPAASIFLYQNFILVQG